MITQFHKIESTDRFKKAKFQQRDFHGHCSPLAENSIRYFRSIIINHKNKSMHHPCIVILQIEKVFSIFSIAKCKSLIPQEKGSYLSNNEKIIHVYENFHPDKPLYSSPVFLSSSKSNNESIKTLCYSNVSLK